MSSTLNQSLCTALGVDATNAVGVTLRLRAGQLPRLTIHRQLIDVNQVKPITERYTLQPAPAPCSHEWDGPTWKSDDGLAESVTCSRCGISAMDHDLRTAP